MYYVVHFSTAITGSITTPGTYGNQDSWRSDNVNRTAVSYLCFTDRTNDLGFPEKKENHRLFADSVYRHQPRCALDTLDQLADVSAARWLQMQEKHTKDVTHYRTLSGETL